MAETKGRGSMKVWSWRQAIQKSCLSSTTKLVLFNLSVYMNDCGEGCYPTTQTQASDTGLSERSVCTHLEIAEEEGFIKKTVHGFSSQKWKRHEYCASFPKGTELGSVPSPKGTELGSVPSPKGTEPDDRKALNDVQCNSPTNSPIEAKLSCAEAQSPNAIIHAFDKAIIETWGNNFQRLCPTATDRMTAEHWIESGMTADFCKSFFEEQFSGMKKRDKPPPSALKFFSSTIGNAFGKWMGSNEPTLTEDQKREAYFLKNGKWLSIWGDIPEHLKKVV